MLLQLGFYYLNYYTLWIKYYDYILLFSSWYPCNLQILIRQGVSWRIRHFLLFLWVLKNVLSICTAWYKFYCIQFKASPVMNLLLVPPTHMLAAPIILKEVSCSCPALTRPYCMDTLSASRSGRVLKNEFISGAKTPSTDNTLGVWTLHVSIHKH